MRRFVRSQRDSSAFEEGHGKLVSVSTYGLASDLAFQHMEKPAFQQKR